jgi:hypothetical protein
MAKHMRAELVVDALQMALARRRPEAGLIHHSDQGSQYVSLAFGQRARDAGVAVSMGSRGDCFDNAVAESFFATLKKELVRRRSWPTRRDLQSAVFDYIESFYNRERRHSTLGYLSPREFEMISISIDKEKEDQDSKPWPVARTGGSPFALGLSPLPNRRAVRIQEFRHHPVTREPGVGLRRASCSRYGGGLSCAAHADSVVLISGRIWVKKGTECDSLLGITESVPGTPCTGVCTSDAPAAVVAKMRPRGC